ncbi:hypothetical protein COLO4_35008 [Corchorus olitorius]|uniref:Uncharacterized protein n=1 Tax=Corchorus olitorius TaxID=93759 RepID=A0A1R3GIJ1_9ROSI|nr:hypothetical protein COLO4_35008 [Corchorus olitorius]
MGFHENYFSKTQTSSCKSDHLKSRTSQDCDCTVGSTSPTYSHQKWKFGLPPYQDELMEDGAMMFTGREFCAILDPVSRKSFKYYSKLQVSTVVL